jgi:hypothetical protein
MRSGKVLRNECERWEFNGIELTSGCLVEIEIDGHWLLGVIEYWIDGYYWFSRRDGIPVILHSGVNARLPQKEPKET